MSTLGGGKTQESCRRNGKSHLLTIICRKKKTHLLIIKEKHWHVSKQNHNTTRYLLACLTALVVFSSLCPAELAGVAMRGTAGVQR